ncbi:hypothetical protein CEP53_009612 [Fusarium sp. AF-6]|nr:hypothetical protein CEP53_009612 [Fusarium sp. AF-6]
MHLPSPPGRVPLLHSGLPARPTTFVLILQSPRRSLLETLVDPAPRASFVSLWCWRTVGHLVVVASVGDLVRSPPPPSISSLILLLLAAASFAVANARAAAEPPPPRNHLQQPSPPISSLVGASLELRFRWTDFRYPL